MSSRNNFQCRCCTNYNGDLIRRNVISFYIKGNCLVNFNKKAIIKLGKDRSFLGETIIENSFITSPHSQSFVFLIIVILALLFSIILKIIDTAKWF